MKNIYEKTCCICGSKHDVHRYGGRGDEYPLYCRKHYSQLREYGKILEITKYDKNIWYLSSDEHGEFAIVELRNSRNICVAQTEIDVEQVSTCLERKWRYEKRWGYATSGTGNNYVMLQNFVLNFDGLIDHIDSNRLNNRKYNLIKSNKSLNALNVGIRSNNSSGVTGVVKNKYCNTWRSYINWNGKRIELGNSETIDEAIVLRLKKEKELLGHLAPQKQLFEEYGV